jgi:integrase
MPSALSARTRFAFDAPSLRQWNRPEPSRKTLIVTGSAAGASGVAVATRQHADAGVNVKVVSERLGHASTSFTLDVYGHVMPGQQADAAAAVANLVDGAP